MPSKQFAPYDAEEVNGLLVVKVCSTEALTPRTAAAFHKSFPVGGPLVAAEWVRGEGRLAFKPTAIVKPEVTKSIPTMPPAKPASVVKKVASIPSGLFRYASGRYG